MLDPAGVTCTKRRGTERMARTLFHALTGGEEALRSAVGEFMRPMLSPALAVPSRDPFVPATVSRPLSTSTVTEGPPGLVQPPGRG